MNIDPSKVDALLAELDRIAQSFNREKLGLPIPGANEDLRAAVQLWAQGEMQQHTELLVELRDWMKSRMPCNAGACCGDLRAKIAQVEAALVDATTERRSTVTVPAEFQDALYCASPASRKPQCAVTGSACIKSSFDCVVAGECTAGSKSAQCEWSEIEVGSGIYNTCEAGEEFHLHEGMELWPYCHLCGRKITVVDHEQSAQCAPEPRVSIAGDMLPTTLAQFQLRAERLLADEQRKLNPDNALISFICDAVRLSRENERLAKPGACRITEYDGAYRCTVHRRKWGAISNPDKPCAGWVRP